MRACARFSIKLFNHAFVAPRARPPTSIRPSPSAPVLHRETIVPCADPGAGRDLVRAPNGINNRMHRVIAHLASFRSNIIILIAQFGNSCRRPAVSRILAIHRHILSLSLSLSLLSCSSSVPRAFSGAAARQDGRQRKRQKGK